MTYQQFLRSLEKTPRTWSVWPDGVIRHKPIDQCDMGKCPILAVGESPVGYWSDIVLAADNVTGEDGYKPEVRADLLRACGLTDE